LQQVCGYNHIRVLGISPAFKRCVDVLRFFCEFSGVTNSAPKLRFGTLRAEGDPDAPLVLWQLKPNCSVTPAQLVQFYLSLCAISLSIAAFFWLQGARMVLAFTALELMAVGVALLVYARHARDGEKIFLQGTQLVVELETAGRTERSEFVREWVRVEPKGGDGSLIEVSGQGRTVVVGRFLRPELRPALAREIRLALRGWLAQGSERPVSR
jgi:uncharacterized membrane protein